MRVRCKFCKNFKDGFCEAKKHGGKPAKVRANTRRDCSEFIIDPTAMAEEADKEYRKGEIPLYAPTWRYYASDRELKEQGEEKGSRFIRINPNARSY